MTSLNKPTEKPNCPNFSSGPCTKRPGWTLDALSDFPMGRSHRSKIGVEKLLSVIEKSKAILGIPEDYQVAIVPGSDTGALEMALWNMLGPRGVDVLAWEVFGNIWVKDVTEHLPLDDVRSFTAPFGQLPDLSQTDTTNRDVIFTWNGTTAGVKIPNGDWIDADRKGLTICDATSALFAMELPWDKLDVVTWSWQKVLGSEAAHGMIALSPRAIERLETYTPTWPLPKLLRLANKGKFIAGPFAGKTINTPSMLAVEDCIDALNWAEKIGGLAAMIKRSEDCLTAIKDWVDASDWIDFLPEDMETCVSTGICLKVTDPWFTALPVEEHWPIVKAVEKMLADEGIAYEVANHRDAAPGFRIWGGSTVEASDVSALLPWLDYGYAKIKADYQAQQAA